MKKTKRMKGGGFLDLFAPASTKKTDAGDVTKTDTGDVTKTDTGDVTKTDTGDVTKTDTVTKPDAVKNGWFSGGKKTKRRISNSKSRSKSKKRR